MGGVAGSIPALRSFLLYFMKFYVYFNSCFHMNCAFFFFDFSEGILSGGCDSVAASVERLKEGLQKLHGGPA